MELTNILIRNGLLLYNTQIPVFSSKSSYIFLPLTFFLSCFIFMFQFIENQTFQELKHWYSMFHFWFQCFIFYLPHPFPKKHNGSDLKTQWERFKTSMGEKSNPNGRNTTETLKSKMKHRMPMFHLLKVLIINALCYENETWDKKRLKVNIMYARVRNDSSPAGNASSPGGDASPRRHLLVKARCLDKQIQYIFLLPSWGIDPQLGNADAGTRLLKKNQM